MRATNQSASIGQELNSVPTAHQVASLLMQPPEDIIIIVKFMAKPNLINRLVLLKAKNTENTSEIATKIFFTGDLGFSDFNKESKDFRRSVVLTCARKQIVHFANSTIKTVFPTS